MPLNDVKECLLKISYKIAHFNFLEDDFCGFFKSKDTDHFFWRMITFLTIILLPFLNVIQHDSVKYDDRIIVLGYSLVLISLAIFFTVPKHEESVLKTQTDIEMGDRNRQNLEQNDSTSVVFKTYLANELRAVVGHIVFLILAWLCFLKAISSYRAHDYEILGGVVGFLSVPYHGFHLFNLFVRTLIRKPLLIFVNLACLMTGVLIATRF